MSNINSHLTQNLVSIDPDQLGDVTGGQCLVCGLTPPLQPMQPPPVQPTQPLQPMQPIQSPSPQGMAPPKYSAGWWDIVRGSGVLQR